MTYLHLHRIPHSVARWTRLGALVALLTLAGCSSSQPAATGSPAEAAASRGSGGDDKDGMKPYDEVIPDDAVTDDGLFTTHRTDTSLHLDVPDSLLGRDVLLATRISRTALDLGYGGQRVNDQVLRFERRADRLLLRVASFETTADPEQPIYQAVQNSSFEPILMAFDIKALTPDSMGVVIDATPLFTSDVPALGLPSSARERFRVRRLDGSRTYLAGVKSFPENVNVEHVLTYEAQEPPSNSATGTITVEMNQSMVLLPKEPMTPRYCDDRVGYFGITLTDYGADAQKAKERCFIKRWKLEPSDPEAFARGELVEPTEPIVYYIDPATPEKWRPYLAQGVEDWNVAFEAAGFKHAIEARMPPSEEEDPDFDPADVRYSTIRYFASTIQNAYGPSLADPRSGQIIESDIGWYHNIMNLLRNWFFVQTAAVNPDARGVAFKDEIMGELMRFVSAHEVGHTLGLPHNWGSSSAVPVDSLRSPAYTDAHGTAPSIMDYARFNYVAQPGDGVTQLMPRVGAYDVWSVEWGYRPLPEADGDPEREEEILNAMILEKAGNPLYFYGRQTFSKIDPRSQNEDLGADAVEASRLGTENLKRIVDALVTWTEREGADYDELEELYASVVRQWGRYLGHVARHVGGMHETFKTYEQDGPVYEPVAADEQRRAMGFLMAEGMQPPTWLVNADLLRRFEHAGTLERVRRAQVGMVEMLMDPERMARLIEMEAMNPEDAYPVAEMLEALRTGLWSELERGEAIGVHRRALQRGYLEHVDYLMHEAAFEPVPARYRDYVVQTPIDIAQSDLRAYLRGELETLRGNVETGLVRAPDRVTRLHLEDVRARIEDTLDPRDG